MPKNFDAVRQELFRHPFTSETTPSAQSIDQQLMVRGVVALEYIAAQLGMIRELLERRPVTGEVQGSPGGSHG